ncbi:MAG: hypothetical protein K8I30_12650, partial [Anaerolineae bacterium]|nr:hypothetical protein [Anaerolineae bacterium]
MLRLGCKISLSMILISGLLAVSARGLGVTRAPNPALQAFQTGCEDQPQPCWFGIVPGKTTEAEINQLLAFAGEPELSRSIFSRDFTLIFTLPQPWPYCRAAFFFVDNVAIRGEIALCREPDIRVGDLAALQHHQDWIISLPPDELIYDHLATNVEGWPAPFRRINFISLLPADARFQHYPWHGFISQRAYCQHE